MIQQLRVYSYIHSNTKLEAEKTKQVLEHFRKIIFRRFEDQAKKLQHHQFKQQHDHNRRVVVGNPEVKLPQLFRPDSSYRPEPIRDLFLRNIVIKLNRTRLTELLNANGIKEFTLSKIKFSNNKVTTAKMHCSDLATSCYVQILSCLNKLEWSFTDDHGVKQQVSATASVESAQSLQDCPDDVKWPGLFEETEFFSKIYRIPELACIIL